MRAEWQKRGTAGLKESFKKKRSVQSEAGRLAVGRSLGALLALYQTRARTYKERSQRKVVLSLNKTLAWTWRLGLALLFTYHRAELWLSRRQTGYKC